MKWLSRLLSRFFTALLLWSLRFYKVVISPLLPPTCRFHPSCSVYAMGAIGVHGPLRGGLLALRRIGRCHPFHAGGLDPVPPRDGRPAEALLETSQPDVARRLTQAPPPHLAALLAPPIDHS